MSLKKKSLEMFDPNTEGSFNSEHKLFIRKNWNSPILKFLQKKSKNDLVYLGLPSPKAEDIIEWIDYINAVFAFQCRKYGEESNPSQTREAIEELTQLLQKLERQNQLDTFIVYDGYFEEVVLRGYDNSPSRINFEISDFITLYNLDFCNKITNPIEYIDHLGERKKAYKFNAINKLLEIQNNVNSSSNKFILFLTVHCSYDGKELENFINYPPNGEVKKYLDEYKKLNNPEKNSRIIRLFFVYYIQQQFESYGFTPKILPVIIYSGLKGTPLLHFTVFGIKSIKTASGILSYQSFNEVINKTFITIDNSKFINAMPISSAEIEVNLNPIDLFVSSDTYNKLWKN
jgi:hypothetical protein